MTDLSAEHLADVLRRVVHSAKDLEQNVFAGLTRREFDQKLQQLLYTSFNFPRSFDEAFHDPGLMLITSGVCFAVAAIVVLVSFRRSGKKSSSERVTSPVGESPAMSRPPKLVIDPPKAAAPASPVRVESVNTEVDVDEFVNRLFAFGFVVTRHKPNNVIKTRCLKLNDQCDLCIFKQFKQKSRVVQPTGGPYMRIPLRDLRDCFPCEGSTPPTFILDFSHKTIQLSTDLELDTNYLVQGFKGLLRRVRKEPQFLATWAQRFQQRLANARGVKSKSGSSSFFFFSAPKRSAGDDDDLLSVSTVNTLKTR